ncbi:hypothetical protein [Arthrobacter sp. PAMC25284]|uniref:hypothetical protein n=1 Tax=Arthrobacter sp. PAMC25284 TaxID=2861279 RepID=UPI001C639B58|nr:hypothetical protein [Arthrobacter sp. PAMC25284]QYF89794.1 hypothetical protein KY499_17585 [Arthrobacter sp. PAMC25284]
MMGYILRFKTAAALVLLGLLTLLAGIGQKTFWAPAENITATAPADATAAPLTVFDEKLRTAHGGPVKINVKGEGSFLLAAGRPDDVAAWVGPTAHNTVTGLSTDGTALEVSHTDGEATAPSPAGSDLWVTSENASGELSYTWTPPADGEWSLLLATDGTKPAPSSITMTFPNDTSTPWAVPFMVLGILLMAGGALLILKPRSGGTGPDSNRRGSRPAAGRNQPTPTAESKSTGSGNGTAQQRRVALRVRRPGLAVALLTAAAVAGTGTIAQASQTPAPGPSTSPETSAGDGEAAGVPVLLDSQFRRVLEQVAGAVDAGDAAKDAGKLEPRVTDTEMQIRTQNYKIRSQVGAYEARMPVRATKLLTTVVTNDRSWPRTVLAVTQGEGNVVPQLLTLTQASARENYKLVNSTPLQPGATFPAISRGGTDSLAPADKSGLLYSGEEALAGLGDRLSSADSAFKDKLVEGESSPYIADTLAYQADVVASGVNGTFSFTHKVDPASTAVFRTSDGGALVLGRLDFTFEGTPKAEGDKLTIGDDAAALAGSKETSTGMVLNFAEVAAVYVPPAGSTDPMRLVAATRGLVGASFK